MPYSDTLSATDAQARKVETVRNLNSVPFAVAVKLQSLIERAAEAPDTTPSALAQLARAWSELEDRKRKIKGKPDPKPIDVTPRVKRGKLRALPAFLETPQADKPDQKAG